MQRQFHSPVLLSVALAAVLLFHTGCTSTPVRMTSDPPGARLQVGDQEWTTPSEVNLPSGTHIARFSIDSDPTAIIEQEIEVPGRMKIFATSLGRGTGMLLQGAAVPFLYVGALGSGIILHTDTSRGFAYASGDRDPVTVVLLVAAAGGFAVGIPLQLAGEYLDDVAYEAVPRAHVIWMESPAEPVRP